MGRFTQDPFAALLRPARPEIVALIGAREGGAEALDLRAGYRPSILHVVEPDPARLPTCEAAFRGLPDLVLHRFALDERPGRIAWPGAGEASTEVRAAILANLMAAEGLPRIDLLCLDAGAAAPRVLRGAGPRLADLRFVLTRLPVAGEGALEAILAGAGFRRRAAWPGEDGGITLLHEGGALADTAPVATRQGFLRRFDREWAPRLMHRATTFRHAFAALLDAGIAAPLVQELGCLRRADGVLHGPPAPPDHPWEWGGLDGPWSEGASTLLFDRFAAACGGQVVSVDHDPAACAIARAATRAAVTRVLQADSLAAIAGGAAGFDTAAADLVYLDTFGAAGAMAQHEREIAALWPRLRPGALLLVDDVADPAGGAGPGERVVGRFLRAEGLVPLAEGSQALWRKP